MKGRTFIGLVFVVAILGVAIPAGAQTHAPWPADWNNWSDPNLMVTVGNPGNAPDTRYDANGYGSVSYEYKIGKYEVAAGQYTEFLNKVAATDTYGLYNTLMANPAYCDWGCNIQRNGASGTYTYSVDPNWANRPVNLVSWGDAARFANWLTNGQPTGSQDANTTEDGSYYLNGATTNEALQAVTRKTPGQGGRYYIPTEDEWYKAAYHKNDSVTGNYWDYPTRTNTTPSNDLLNPDGGNNANYYDGIMDPDGYTIGGPYYRTEVGEFENSESPYGTFDQGGNVQEWNEAILSGGNRDVRGGAAYGSYDNDFLLHASSRVEWGDTTPTFSTASIGFRIVEVPEPASLSLLALSGVALMRRRK